MENIELLKELSKPLPIEGRQKTDSKKTFKGYNTDGYGYQWCVDRFNNFLGEDWGFSWEVINTEKGITSKGKPQFELTVSVGIWVHDKNNIRKCAGGHISSTYTDALKGAITSGFKKTAAFWGVGCDAYRGTIDNPYVDDDNTPYPEGSGNGSVNGKDNGNGNGKSKASESPQPPADYPITPLTIEENFRKLRYPPEYLSLYWSYYHEKYKIGLSQTTNLDFLYEQNKIISKALNDKSQCEAFRKHLDGFAKSTKPAAQTTPVSTTPPQQPGSGQQVQQTTPAGNGREAGVRRKISAKLDVIFSRSSDAISAWLSTTFGSSDLNSMGLDSLQRVLGATDEKFKEYKTSIGK